MKLVALVAEPTKHRSLPRQALVTEPKSIVRYLAKLGEPIDVPARSTSRGPHWKSTVLRGKAGA